MIAAHAFASSCFRETAPYEVTKAVIKEIGSYAVASALTSSSVIMVAVSSNPAFLTVLAIGVAGAGAALAYSWLIDFAWKVSSRHHLTSPMDPVYATPNIEGLEFMKSYQGQFRKVRTKRHPNPKWGFRGDALPEEFFTGRSANREDYVGITSNDFGSGINWLIQLK